MTLNQSKIDIVRSIMLNNIESQQCYIGSPPVFHDASVLRNCCRDDGMFTSDKSRYPAS